MQKNEGIKGSNEKIIQDYKAWLELQKYSVRTIENYLLMLKLYQRIVKDLTQPTQEEINKVVEKHNHRVMRAFLKNFINEYLQNRNIIVPKIKGRYKHRIKYIKPEHIKLLIKSARRPYQKALISLAFETGLRASELINIRVKDINWRDNSVEGVGKGNKPFKVFFSDETRAYLIQSIKGLDWSERLFKNWKSRHSLKMWFARFTKKVLGRHFGVHALRHSTGTYLRSQGVPIEQIKDYLRHESINTTMIYAHSVDKERSVKRLFKNYFVNKEVGD